MSPRRLLSGAGARLAAVGIVVAATVMFGGAPALAAPTQLPIPVPPPNQGASAALDPAAGDPTVGAGSGDPAAGTAVTTPTPAPPPKPTNATDARAQLDQVQHDAEALTEQWHAAQDTVAARQADVAKMQAAVQPAELALTQAQTDEETYRQQVDAVTTATYEAGNLDQLDALLVATSPQAYLDQMSALEMLSSDYKDVLQTLVGKVDHTRTAQAAAAAAVARAQAAVNQATLAEQDLSARKLDAQTRIGQAEQLLQELTPAQLRERDDNGVAGPEIFGSGVGVDALRAAATQLGKPYVWGATGPTSFDCSGLTSWAFRQIGVTLPRSSSQQATVGTPVSWDNLQPGDLVFYYHPVSHVGIYAGNGIFLDAPQSGDVVKYQQLLPSLFSAARRI